MELDRAAKLMLKQKSIVENNFSVRMKHYEHYITLLDDPYYLNPS